MAKKLSVPRGNFSNVLMKIIVFSQLYRSKSAALARDRVRYEK